MSSSAIETTDTVAIARLEDRQNEYQLVTVIEARTGWQLVNLRELNQYRDLFRFLTWRSIKILYAQSAIGIGWAIIQPLFSMLIFTAVFGRFAGISSEGVPYALFSL